MGLIKAAKSVAQTVAAASKTAPKAAVAEGLKAVKKADKDGRIVTRYIREDAAKPSSKAPRKLGNDGNKPGYMPGGRKPPKHPDAARLNPKPDPADAHRIDVKPPTAPKGHPQAHTVTRDKASGIEKHEYSDGSKRFIRPGTHGHTTHSPVTAKTAAAPKPKASADQRYVERFGHAPPKDMSEGAKERWVSGPFKAAPGQTGDAAYEKAVSGQAVRMFDAKAKQAAAAPKPKPEKTLKDKAAGAAWRLNNLLP